MADFADVAETDWSEWGKPTYKVKHEHCGVCGACLLHSGQLHKCPAAVELDILAVFLSDSQRVNVSNRKTDD